jgi:DNA-binding transcriptional regulator YiaG
MKKPSTNRKSEKPSKISRKNLEQKFDNGENLLDYFDPASASILWPAKAPETLAGLRKKTGMTQDQFSKAICISSRTLQQWEQGRREPEGPAKALLRLVSLKPSLIKLLSVR